MKTIPAFLCLTICALTSSQASARPTCSTNWTARDVKGSRPAFEYSIESSQYPVTVHAMSSTSREYSGRILSFVETSWDRIINKMNFRAPRPDGGEGGDDRVDIYIRDDLMAGVGGYTGFTGFYDLSPEADATGYLVIADNLKDTYIRGVVAHEFFHLSQMAYDWFEHPGFMEATAVWITDHVFDDENFYQNYYAYYNKSPHQALDKISLADPYQYGAGLWFQYLDERHGTGHGSVVRDIWDRSIQTDMNNDPDYFDAMSAYLRGDDNLNAAFRDFGAWRLRVSRYAGADHLREADKWPERVIPTVYDGGALKTGAPLSWTLPNNMQPFSHSYIKFSIPEDSKINTTSIVVELDSPARGKISHDIVTLSDNEIIVILTRTSDESYDPETSSEDAIDVSGTITLNATTN